MNGKKKKKNNKRIIVILVLLAVIALAVGLVALITSLSKKTEPTVETDDAIEVFSMPQDKMERIEWIYKGEEYAVYRDGDVWKLSSDPALELYQSACKAMASGLEVIKADKFVDSDDKEAMGFNEPSTVVKLRADGKEYVFTFGSETATGSNYYMEYDGKIAVVRSYEKTVFDKGILALTGEEEPIDTSLTKVEEEDLTAEDSKEETVTEPESVSYEEPESEAADLGEPEPETGVPEEDGVTEGEDYTGMPEEEATTLPEKDDIQI